MHKIINQFLFLSALAWQSATGFPAIIWREPKRKPKSVFNFGKKLKRKYK